MKPRTETLLSWLKRGRRCDFHKAAELWGWSQRQYQRTVDQLKQSGWLIDSDRRYDKTSRRYYASHQLIRTR